MKIYLDYASHTPVSEAVLEAFCEAERRFTGNPLSTHAPGRAAGQELSRITGVIAELLQVNPDEIIFTSGASEANNLAIKGIARGYGYKGRHILSTCLEHPSVSGTLSALQDDGFEIELVRILPTGTIDLEHLKSAIRPDTILLCISAIDSELGVVQPIGEISKIVEEHPNCHLHIDAAQAIGKIHVDMHKASTMCFSPHKFYGLPGSGVLVKREGVVLEPLIHGGGWGIYRGGTPALGLATACHKALELALANLDNRLAKVTSFREYLVENLARYPKVRINSPEGSPYILNLSVRGVKAAVFTAALDKHGVCVSIKSACSTDNAPSRPVMAVSQDRQNALCSWRISLSHMTEISELDGFMQIFCNCYNQLAM
ncbi:MAG: aminotransferase class V-fold PLP-dependent enzyme [Defluviitaleaceae bacterium]|nr:aminotransferase class V-fold PLP-dependent enzyme [Defluviitaleaceae bacterium]